MKEVKTTLKISVKTSSGEFVEAKEYLSLYHGYEFIPQTYTIKDVVAELVVLREELDTGTFYSYWVGPADCLQCIRRYPEQKGV